MFQLSECDKYGVNELLNLRVPGPGLIEHLGDKVDQALNLINVLRFFVLDHDNRGDHTICCRDVQEKSLFACRCSEDRRQSEELF